VHGARVVYASSDSRTSGSLATSMKVSKSICKSSPSCRTTRATQVRWKMEDGSCLGSRTRHFHLGPWPPTLLLVLVLLLVLRCNGRNDRNGCNGSRTITTTHHRRPAFLPRRPQHPLSRSAHFQRCSVGCPFLGHPQRPSGMLLCPFNLFRRVLTSSSHPFTFHPLTPSLPVPRPFPVQYPVLRLPKYR